MMNRFNNMDSFGNEFEDERDMNMLQQI